MAYKFGERSKKHYNTLHDDIKVILDNIIQYYDFSIIEGHRSIKRQKELFDEGKSKLDGVNRKGKHNSYPSMAVDIMPYKKGTNAFSGMIKDKYRFYYLMGLVRAESERLLAEGKISHRVRFGVDWNSNDVFDDQNFDDMPHFELVKA